MYSYVVHAPVCKKRGRNRMLGTSRHFKAQWTKRERTPVLCVGPSVFTRQSFSSHPFLERFRSFFAFLASARFLSFSLSFLSPNLHLQSKWLHTRDVLMRTSYHPPPTSSCSVCLLYRYQPVVQSACATAPLQNRN